MTIKLRQKKRLYTDDEIDEFCKSVEKLLLDINERKAARKAKKIVDEVEDIPLDKDNPDKDDWPISPN